MFYSHNLLARKGPLGTVWCAAHLQSKLKKSNYITINIPSTVEQIMNPQVPIALRMSGHLLLGVVRIYSKKVEYLQHDYNVLRIDINRAYVYANINLPEDANQARFESITLPDNFALDELNLDDFNREGSPDRHLRSPEEISLTDQSPSSLSKKKDQIPAGYFFISLSEDTSNHPSRSEDDSGSRPMPMEEDPHPPNPVETTANIQDPGSSNHMEFNDNFTTEDSDPQIETLRDAVQEDLLRGPPSILPDTEEPDLVLGEFLKEKDKGSPTLDEMLVPGGGSLPSKQAQPLDSTPSELALDNSDPHLSFGLASVDIVLQPSPVEPDQPRGRKRKIKYDENTVLTNEFMKKALDDPHNLLRKRKGVCTSLGIWKLNNKRKKEQVLVDPLITGLCDNLSELFEKDIISRKPHLVAAKETQPEFDTEIENLRNFEGPSEETILPMYSPDQTAQMHSADNTIEIRSTENRSFSSPAQMGKFASGVSTDVGSKSYVQTTTGTSMRPTPDPMSSTGSYLSEMETPMPFIQELQGFENSGLSDIPEMSNSGDLTFLEDDEITPGLRGTPEAVYSSGKQRPPPEASSLSARTRAVAQYLKEKSSVSPSSLQKAHGDLKLDSILQGKRRTLCARMFFETLVLKSCDLVDVKQEEPYGDIAVKVTSKLSKEQFST